MHTVKEVIHALNTFAPPQLAESWDHVGLMVGSEKAEVKRVLCALDLNLEVIDEAIRIGAQMIVTHHPLLFKPIHSIQYDTPMGQMLYRLIKNDLTVFSMHTNFDIVQGGINDYLAHQLGLTSIKPLQVTASNKFQKLIVYVPQSHYESVRDAIIQSNKATIGQYSGCTFGSEGIGTFIPLEGSHPYRGETHQLEQVQEVKLECMVHPNQLQELMAIIQNVHPYEEIAYDVYNLENVKQVEGIGRVGTCETMQVKDVIQRLKQIFNIPYVRLVGKEDQKISKVALCSGSGGSLISQAAHEADLYITGDVSFHQAQEAISKGLVVVDVGHYASENIAMPIIEKYLKNHFQDMEVVCSKVNGETFQTL